MRTMKLLKSLPPLCLLFLITTVSCITIPDTVGCAVRGKMSGGAVCGHTLTPQTQNLSLAELIDFLEAQSIRTCVPVPGLPICADDQTKGTPVALPARGGGIIMSSADYSTVKTDLEITCRDLGSDCSYSAPPDSSTIAPIPSPSPSAS